ncbi:GntR family transcriptional regulator [Lactobacillus iners]|jgi:ubiC transcription regulator-associated domain protein|uniref:GntR family transcriptional regulator n=1 Tax=Lactobacillus iners TaxID=147802 RepID=UPI0013E1EB9B|nr:GntR family transcriptional regulator [Lactobacillus iners]MCT7692923.1 GntR family transcriptional regulator [Lactobacillus iners]MCT7715951.1 GntR family transcriptional regulator [Lactobacillus iners]MCT7734838.1 GntR family transcriptional regulator [Lactobacillus iners]MCT7811763.1 GntR family transcriptional regulator [Lactobacillus iners]MCT7818173.1 GntR family transcriptional regulator [Lactobacillus iners]
MTNSIYKKLIAELKKIIETNLQPNQKLPSERKLVQIYQVSRNTVRLALNELEQKGYIYRIHGKGTFVSSIFLNQTNLGTMYSFSDEMNLEGRTPTTKNLSLRLLIPDKNISLQLNLSEGEKVYELIRLRLANDEPLIYSKTYLPQKFFPELKIEELNKDTLYGVMEKIYKQSSVLALEDIQAVNLSAEESKILHVKNNAASLKINRRLINENNIPIEFTKALARGDKFVYRSKQYK